LTRCGLDTDLYYESAAFDDLSTPAAISVLGCAVSDISHVTGQRCGNTVLTFGIGTVRLGLPVKQLLILLWRSPVFARPPLFPITRPPM